MTPFEQELSHPAATVAGTINVDERNTTMTTITCPAWCDSHIQEDDGTLLAHRGECGFETDAGDQVLVTLLDNIIPAQFDPASTWVDLHAVDCTLSPTDARRAAVALLAAADQADGREPEPWENLVTWWLANARAGVNGVTP